MRLFVAADLSDSTREELGRIADGLRPALAAGATPPRLVWVDPAAAHVTLRFIGNVPDEKAAAIIGVLRAPFAVPPFDVEWSTLGMFPPRGAPRVIWLGSAGEMTPLQHLAARVHDRVDAIVGPGESKPFRPHVTLARVKDPGRRVDWAGALGGITVVRTITHVDSVTLYESHTGPRGSTYTVRMRTPLIAPAAPRGTG